MYNLYKRKEVKTLSLRTKRLEKGLRQKDAADIIGIKQQRLSHYEHGIRQPKPFMLKKLAELYGCTIDELIGDEDDKAGEKRSGRKTGLDVGIRRNNG